MSDPNDPFGWNECSPERPCDLCRANRDLAAPHVSAPDPRGGPIVEATRPDGTPVAVAPACPHGYAAGIGCLRCKDARIAELEREVARLREEPSNEDAGHPWWEGWAAGTSEAVAVLDYALGGPLDIVSGKVPESAVGKVVARVAALREEVARLEALIGIDADLHAEADRIRAKP